MKFMFLFLLFSLFFSVAPAFAILGFRTNYCYEYHRVSETLVWGDVDYWFTPDTKVIDEGRKKKCILGAPYYLSIHPKTLKFEWEYYEVSKLVLKNAETAEEFKFPLQRNAHLGTMKDTGLVALYTNLDLPYNDYELTGVITFFKGEEKVRTHKIQIKFKKNYRKKITNDFIEGMWSI